MVTQCCQCHRIRENDCWVIPKESSPIGEPVSHGYCPHCAVQFMLDIKAYCSNSNRAFTLAATDSGLKGVGQQKRSIHYEER